MTPTDVLLLCVIPLQILAGWGLGRGRRRDAAAEAERRRLLEVGGAGSLIDAWLERFRMTCPLLTLVHDSRGCCGVVVGLLICPFPPVEPPCRLVDDNLYCDGVPDAPAPIAGPDPGPDAD